MALAFKIDPLPTPPAPVRAKALGISSRPFVTDLKLPPRMTIDVVDHDAPLDREGLVKQMVVGADMQIDPDADDEAVADEYPIPTEDMRAAARALATKIVLGAWNASGDRPAMPRFGAAGDGGVGLHWRTPRIELLVTLSPHSSAARYYGETFSGTTVKGAIAPTGPTGFLAQWLVEHDVPDRGDP